MFRFKDAPDSRTSFSAMPFFARLIILSFGFLRYFFGRSHAADYPGFSHFRAVF